jgi:hypothetical protein
MGRAFHPAPTPFCFSEDIMSQMDLQGASEKEPLRGREEQERVVKQWERDQESEREATDDEQDRKSSGGLSKKLLGDGHSSNLGIRRESREIYRRLSDYSSHLPSEDGSQKQEKKQAEAAKGEVQKLEKTKEE